MSRATVTDRALRYRANEAMPQDAPAVCFACGVVRGLEIGHLDGHEENQAPENLAYTCRSCNVTCANTLRKAGAGRLTNQYNPARNRTHYMNAVNVMLGRSRDMSLRSAIQTVQGTSHVNRAAYARGLKTNPGAETLGAYMSAVVDHRRGAHDQGGRIIHETPKARRSRFAREIARIKAERYGSGGVPDWVTSNPALSASQYGLAQAVAAGTNRLPTGMTAAAAKRMIEHTPAKLRAYFAQQLARQNPAAGSREAFKDFHGFKPTMKTTVVRTVHEHEHVAGIGELIELWIVPLDQETPEGKKDRCIRLKDFDGAWLTQSENKKLPQLFIDGGDQVIDDDTLAECGVDLDALHEVEVLGKGVLVKYYTIKTHLGREGGEAEYSHPFGETLDESGNRVFTGKASRPVITYDTVNRQLFVVGGKYTIPPEGISN